MDETKHPVDFHDQTLAIVRLVGTEYEIITSGRLSYEPPLFLETQTGMLLLNATEIKSLQKVTPLNRTHLLDGFDLFMVRS